MAKKVTKVTVKKKPAGKSSASAGEPFIKLNDVVTKLEVYVLPSAIRSMRRLPVQNENQSRGLPFYPERTAISTDKDNFNVTETPQEILDKAGLPHKD